MRRNLLVAAAAATFLLLGAAFAQHNHGNMGSMEGGMGHNSSGTHDSPKATESDQKSPSDFFSGHAQLAAKLQGLLPKNMTPEQACSGFKNMGQCIATIHVSHNLGVNFTCMKADMTGTAPPAGSSCPAGTGSKTLGLAKSIQSLQPTADVKSEVKKATQQAEDDLKGSGA